MTEKRRAELETDLATWRAERDQLEAAWPPHGVKPDHLRRIEELEELIEAGRKELASFGSDGG